MIGASSVRNSRILPSSQSTPVSSQAFIPDNSQLPAHAARARRRRNVRRDGQRTEPPAEALGHGAAQGDALGTGAHRVARVLDVAAADEGAVGGEDDSADTKAAVGAVGGGLGLGGLARELGELGGGEAVGGAGGGDVLWVGAGEDLGLRHGGGSMAMANGEC